MGKRDGYILAGVWRTMSPGDPEGTTIGILQAKLADDGPV